MSTSTTVLTSLLVGGAIGYYIGVSSTQASPSLSSPPSPSSEKSGSTSEADKASASLPPPVVQELAPKDTETEWEDENDEDAASAGLGNVKAGSFEECKLVLVVRTDLGMTKGKIAAQCSHATLACYKSMTKHNPKLLRHWERIGQAKIALRCESEEELLILQATAQSLNLCAQSIQDAGRTQIAAGSTTVLGIGPAPAQLINQVTGHLKLL